MQRLITRLGDIPVAVSTADWTVLSWTPLWAALVGDPLLLRPSERNVVHQAFLRTASGAHPHDRRLAALIARANAESPRFAQLWASGAVGSHASDRKTVSHPQVGDLTLDCDILTVPGADLEVVAYTVAAGTPDAEELDFLRVVGAHSHRTDAHLAPGAPAG